MIHCEFRLTPNFGLEWQRGWQCMQYARNSKCGQISNYSAVFLPHGQRHFVNWNKFGYPANFAAVTVSLMLTISSLHIIVLKTKTRISNYDTCMSTKVMVVNKAVYRQCDGWKHLQFRLPVVVIFRQQ